MHNEITLSRDVEAIQIPSGDKIELPLGTKVMITQALGGTYTVATNFGLARIKSENADALGIDLEAEKNKQPARAKPSPPGTSKAPSGSSSSSSTTPKSPST